MLHYKVRRAAVKRSYFFLFGFVEVLVDIEHEEGVVRALRVLCHPYGPSTHHQSPTAMPLPQIHAAEEVLSSGEAGVSGPRCSTSSQNKTTCAGSERQLSVYSRVELFRLQEEIY